MGTHRGFAPLWLFRGETPLTAAGDGIRELAKEIGSGSYDLILADYSDAAALEKQIPAAKRKPSLIPVMYNPAPDQRAAAEKEYSCLVAPAKKNYDLLKVIDQAMTTRPESSGPKCQKTRV